MHVCPFNFISRESDLIVWIRLDPAPNVSIRKLPMVICWPLIMYFSMVQHRMLEGMFCMYLGHNSGMLMLLKGREESPAVVPYTLLHCWWLKFQSEPDLSFSHIIYFSTLELEWLWAHSRVCIPWGTLLSINTKQKHGALNCIDCNLLLRFNISADNPYFQILSGFLNRET